MTNFQIFILYVFPVVAAIGGYFYARSARNIGHKHHHPAE